MLNERVFSCLACIYFLCWIPLCSLINQCCVLYLCFFCCFLFSSRLLRRKAEFAGQISFYHVHHVRLLTRQARSDYVHMYDYVCDMQCIVVYILLACLDHSMLDMVVLITSGVQCSSNSRLD